MDRPTVVPPEPVGERGGSARRHPVACWDSAVGSSLDVSATARELARVAARLGDRAVVFLVPEAFTGHDPPLRTGPVDLALRCAARCPAQGWPAEFIAVDGRVPRMPDTEIVRRYQRGEAAVGRGLAEIHRALAHDPESIRRLVPGDDPRITCVFTPLVTQPRPGDPDAPGHLLGSLQVWHLTGGSPAPDADDVLAQRHLAQRAALALDNARRYTRELRMVRELQQSLLPRVSSAGTAETAASYVTASRGASGDWWDAVALPSLRVALVVGDVVGHGLEAAAMMGRLRTAVQTLAVLDLPPDEILTLLDDLVTRLTDERSARVGDGSPTGSTCCVSVYDPVRELLTTASAGHPPPALVRADGTARYLELSPGPPLGVGRLAAVPTEVTTAVMRPGDLLALYTDGLVGDHHDIGAGMDALLARLSAARLTDLDAAARELIGLAPGVADDATLLLARARGVPDGDTEAWRLPAREEQVSAARAAATRWLTGRDAPADLVVSAGLVVSELMTNAVRYGGGRTMGLRLIRDGGRLIVEAHDASDTAPHLKRALPDEEGGRGLLIVAQLARGRWGVRHAGVRAADDADPLRTGKTIWAEIPWGGGTPAAALTAGIDLTGLGLG